MAKFKMKQLALAMGTVLGGMSLLPSAQAVNLATDGLGQVLIFPYYTTRAGWNTLLNVTNTSNHVVAIKVRFHEGYNSRDVFDFNVILSPHDVWNGTVSNGPGDVPIFGTSDTTCTVPAIPAGGQLFQGGGANGLLAYTGAAADGGPTTTDRMREGYISIIMMGSSPAVGLAASAVHTAARVPANCAALRNAFALSGTTMAGLKAAFPNYGDPAGITNPLKGAFSLVNATSGWNASGEAVALADFYNPLAVPGAAPNLITAQLPPASVAAYSDSFHEPELSSANTPGEVLDADGALLTNAPVTGADAVSFVLQRASVVNQWANLPAGVAPWTVMSDLVVTYPTKRFYVDNAAHEFSGRAAGRTGLPAGLSPFSSAFAGGRSCDRVGYAIYDREEQTTTSGPVFSPAPTAQGLCNEVNVLTFGAAANATETNVLGPPDRKSVV